MSPGGSWRWALAALASTLALAALGTGPAGAHVGSPDTWFEGAAGPYSIRVVVRAPGVVPGLARLDVRVLRGTSRSVTVQPFAWNAGPTGAPPPDVAHPVPGDAQLYSVSLWLMVPTSYGVHVTVSGSDGQGTAIVPVQAVATQRLPMAAKLEWILVALGLFLFVGLVTVVGAAVRDGPLPPGQQPDAARVARARAARVATAILLAVGLAGGRAWWNSVDRAHAAGMFRPFHATASLVDSAGGARVRLTIDDPRWRGREWTPLISDHGKLMHLFLVRDGDLGAMAHLHPVPSDSERFDARLPPLPAGHYRAYADLVHESGFTQTLTAALDLPPGPPAGPGATATGRSRARHEPGPFTPSDADDAWFTGEAAGDADSAESRFALGDGSTLLWERGSGPILERQDHPLRFRVTASDGSLADLEPYLGMSAHAVVTSADGTVFAHLHPVGTVSMAAQMALTMRTPADSIPGALGRRLSVGVMGGHAMPLAARLPGEFSIPYGFPRTGRYRLWIQVKRGGAVRTAAFDATVKAARPPR